MVQLQSSKWKKLDRILSALNRIDSRRSKCKKIADFGKSLVDKGRLSFFSNSTWNQSGGIGGEFSNGGGPMVAIMADYIERFSNKTFEASGETSSGKNYRDSINLEWILIHEVEHAMGYSSHVNGDPWLTPNVQKCSGLN